MPVPVMPPLLELHDTVKSITAAPLLLPGVNETFKELLPLSARSISGAAGAAAGTASADSGDDAPVPMMFVAMTEHVYGLPLVRPVTTRGERCRFPCP